MEMQRAHNSQDNLKKNKVGGQPLPYFKSYHQGAVIKELWYQKQTNKSLELNRESRNRPAHTCTTDFNKSVKAIEWGKTWSFQYMMTK